MEIVRHLVERVGCRWAGRSATAEAAAYLIEQFSGLDIQVRRQDFPFLGWEVDREPELEILEPERMSASVALMEYSGSTPENGVQGYLHEAGTADIVPGFLEWPQYALVSDSGSVVAYLIVHIGLSGWEAPPIPLRNPEPLINFPMAILAEDNHRSIKSWIDRGKKVRASFIAQGHPEAPLWGHNVVATLPGASDRSLVFCAHLDTAYNTPGANNNAGGIQALYDLAVKLVQKKERLLTYHFLVCDACEWGFLGSHYFLREAKREGRFDSILAGINIDTVASGDRFYFLSWPETMRRRAERVVERLNLRRRFKHVEFLGRLAGSDHYAFLEAGLPAAEILFWPCPVYKLSEDDIQHIDEDLIGRSTEIAFALAQTFEEEPS